MTYETKNFDHLIGLEGFSDESLKNHFTLYNGYVLNANKLADILADMLKSDKTALPEFAELKRRFGWEFNGARLHEYYFGNLTKNGEPLDKNSGLFKKIENDFGSYDQWQKDFKAAATMRGIGWVILYYDKENDKLFNAWINEHDLGHLSGATPLLVLDVFEHAYLTDYGIKRIDYIETFFKTVNWKEAEKRLG